MNILFLAANPIDTNRLRLDEEIRTIDQRLRGAGSRDKFELVNGFAARPSDLAGYLLRYQPYIVHFSGHGSNDGQLVLQDNNGNRKLLTPPTLSRLFRALKDNTKCVVLNACFSAIQAQTLVSEIGCVVGMSRSISDTAAIDFAGGFYETLGYDRSVQTAFDVGCTQIDMDNLEEADTPKLLVREGVDASQLFFNNKSGLAPTPDPGADQISMTKTIVEAFLSAFPREADLNQLVTFVLAKNLRAIAGGDTLTDITLNLIGWTITNNQLPTLIRGAREENPGNLKLKAVAAEMGIE
ncbi:MAG: CHAT domain-containing protein [Chloroflexota bacterium]|nr:CHAT domain-containing protein [Chloroflexota bacterium]